MELLTAVLLAIATLATATLATYSRASAEVSLPKVFSSHMVLQRDMPIHVWGNATPGEQVLVDFHRTTVFTTTGSNGRWSVYLPAQPAGGPFTLSIKASNNVQFDDIPPGDLWVASGPT